ncbi:MAG: flagellar biosynthesis repressor FlbT, partial [Rhodospirillales bacterium]|nr:flagellar biosynthesis repressor FlbT [Rhodospirillales bacterium]
GDKMIINGAVVENVGSNAKFVIHNDSAILREKEVLTDEETKTPASRIYYALQCAYVFPHQKEESLKKFREFLGDFVKACPSTKPVAEEIEGNVAEGRLYKGLKLSQKLITHESMVFSQMQSDMEKHAMEIEAAKIENEAILSGTAEETEE